MNQPGPERLDDLTLGAFVDGHLDVAHRERVLRAMEEDLAVRERVYRLRRAKDLMRIGFESVQPPPHASAPTGGRRGRRWGAMPLGLVATVLIALGGLSAGPAGLDSGGGVKAPVATAPGTVPRQATRIVLHISESDPKQFAAVLSYIRSFLKTHPAGSGQIAVVANAGGLNLLRAGVSPYEREVRELTLAHPNVHFIACANSIRALRRHGVRPTFLRNVDTSKPALDQIIALVQAGWTYVKVESLPHA